MSEFLSAYGTVIGVITGLFVIALTMFSPYGERVRFWWMDFWYTLPFIGKIKQLAKDPTRSADGRWMNAERHLCGDYNKYIHFIGEPVFRNHIEFLRRANDLGRSPTPLWAIVLLGILVIAEGLGFSYLLGGMIAADGSANVRSLLMYAIVTVICIVTVWITHAAGHQYFRTSLLRACFKRFKESGGHGRFFSGKVVLSDDQTKDDGEPDHTQCANRVCENPADQGSYGIMIVAAIFIAAIAIGSTWMRWENLRKDMIEQTAATQHAEATGGNPFAAGGRLALPEEVTQPQKVADAKALEEAAAATKSGSLAGFLMLAFIFVVTQFVGISVGFKYGFASKQSKEAYRETRGFQTYDAYLAYYQRYIDLATARLHHLQQQMEEVAHEKLNLEKTFRDFIVENARESAKLRHNVNQTVGATFGATATPAAATASIVVPAEPGHGAIAIQLAKLDKLADKAAKKEHLKALQAVDETLHADVLNALRARKEEDDRRRQQAEESEKALDSLL